MSDKIKKLGVDPIDESNINDGTVFSVAEITERYSKHLDLKQMMFAEHFAVVRDEVESVRVAGYTDEDTTYADAKMLGQRLLQDKYIEGYISDLRSFSLADGLFATYNEAIGYLVSVMNGTVRDVNGTLEFPKVSERTKASMELVKILPESPQLVKLKADTEKVEVDTELQREKVRMLKSGGMSEQENQVLDVLKSIGGIGGE